MKNNILIWSFTNEINLLVLFNNVFLPTNAQINNLTSKPLIVS